MWKPPPVVCRRVRFVRLAALGVLALLPRVVGAGPLVRSGEIRASDGVMLHYLEAGQGPALVFVPGWTMPGRIFSFQLGAFAGRFRVVALDPRWHGASGKPAGPVALDRMGDDLADLASGLGLDRMALVGWSLGADEALAYATRHGTGGLRSLVLLDEPLSDPTPDRRQAREAFLARFARRRPAATLAFVRSMYRRPHAEAYYRSLTDDALRVPTPVALDLLRLGRAPTPWPLLASLGPRLLYAVIEDRRDEAALVRAKAPTARVEVLAAAGHAWFADEPERFNALLAEFLGSQAE